jgi:hypothetical protein
MMMKYKDFKMLSTYDMKQLTGGSASLPTCPTMACGPASNQTGYCTSDSTDPYSDCFCSIKGGLDVCTDI